MNNEDLLQLLRNQEEGKQQSLWDRFQIILKRKTIIIVSIIAVVAVVLLINAMADPSYSASVILKKEKSPESSRYDEFKQILEIQTRDVIETEIELVTTRAVLDKVAADLDLALSIEKVEIPGKETIEIGESYLDYQHDYAGENSDSRFPQFINAEINPGNYGGYFYIKRTSSGFELRNAETEQLIKNLDDPSTANYSFDNNNVTLYWPNSVINSKIYFYIDNFYSSVEELKGSISVEHKEKTDLFSVTVTTSSPYSAVRIANTVTDKYREARMDQQRQGIRETYKFAEEQLQKVSEDLKESENELSNYRSGNRMLTLSASAQDVASRLAQLEAERENTKLLLAEYESKMKGIKNAVDSKGYFDQTNSSVAGGSGLESPFSSLMRQKSSLEVERIQLLQKRTENHPDVVSIDNQIKEIEKELSKYNQNTLENYKITKSTLENKIDNLNVLIGQYESSMQSLPSKETKLAELLRKKNVSENMFNILLDKREEMRMAELSQLQNIVVIDPANKAHSATNQIHPALAIIFGLVLGVGGAFVVESINNKITNLDDIEKEFNLPILAIIPKYSKEIQKKIREATDYKNRFVTLMGGQDGFKESYRVLRTKLSSASQADDQKRIIMFTSCEENTGKTTIVSNLAVSLAMANKKVLVIDCDLRKARLSDSFEMSKSTPGLINFLTQDINIPNIYNLNKLIENGRNLRTLNILPSGGIYEDSSDLLGSEKMEKLIGMIKDSSYDYILIDTPPVTRVVDTLVLGKYLNELILVIRPEHTIKDSVTWGIQELERENIKVNGVVVNACDIENSYFKHRYGYGYGYEYKESKDGRIKTKINKNKNINNKSKIIKS